MTRFTIIVSSKKSIPNTLISLFIQDCSEIGGQSDWIGDGFCDDINNNAMCTFQWVIGPGTGLPLWDGGDCCGSEAKLNYCTYCTCNGELKINKQPSGLLLYLEVCVPNWKSYIPDIDFF